MNDHRPRIFQGFRLQLYDNYHPLFQVETPRGSAFLVMVTLTPSSAGQTKERCLSWWHQRKTPTIFHRNADINRSLGQKL